MGRRAGRTEWPSSAPRPRLPCAQASLESSRRRGSFVEMTARILMLRMGRTWALLLGAALVARAPCASCERSFSKKMGHVAPWNLAGNMFGQTGRTMAGLETIHLEQGVSPAEDVLDTMDVLPGSMTTGGRDLMYTLDKAEQYDGKRNGANWVKEINHFEPHLLSASPPPPQGTSGNSSYVETDAGYSGSPPPMSSAPTGPGARLRVFTL